MRYYEAFPPYVPVAQRRAKAEKQLRQMQKKNPRLKPVILTGNSLASTWWGKSWNKNLERYADYSNRIGRGRSYVRHHAVLDLQLASGKIEVDAAQRLDIAVALGNAAHLHDGVDRLWLRQCFVPKDGSAQRIKRLSFRA